MTMHLTPPTRRVCSPRTRRPSAFALCFVFISLFSIALSAQVAADLSGELYDDLEFWLERGYISNLPPVRPYPAQLLVPLLEQAARKGTADDRERAEGYLERLGSGFSLHASGSSEIRTGSKGFFSETGGGFTADGFIAPSVSGSLRLDVLATDQADGQLIPAYSRERLDYNLDWADIDLGGTTFLIKQSLASTVAFGSESAWFQAGITRSSYGPFFDSGGIVSASAPHAGHFSFTWRARSFTYNALLLQLVASTDRGTGKFTDKFFYLHGITFRPASWLEIGAFESAIWGGRFDLIYLLPLKELYYAQSMTGFADNSLFGLTLDLTPVGNTRFSLTLNVDDLHFNNMVRFKFDTKYKLSLQYGAAWSPDFRWLRRLTASHLLVMPYMYTHIDTPDANDPNYQNYTHLGTNLGAELQPNSDRIAAGWTARPLPFLDLSANGVYIRHGNASEGWDILNGDGTIWDPGYDSADQPTFQGHTRFLEQPVLERTLQLGLSASSRLPIPGRLAVTARAGYTFERIENPGLVEGETEVNHYVTFGLSLSY